MDLIAEENWSGATRILQGLFDAKEDVFMPVVHHGAGGKETTHLTSVRAEASRLLDTLPAAGLEFYEASYGAQAKVLLSDARARDDPELLAQIAQRFFFTEAGAEATRLLGTQHLDRGRFEMAAACFERLLDRPRRAQLSPLLLFQAAVAFQRAGDAANVERAWKLLADKAPNGLRLGDRTVGLDRLHQQWLTGTGAAREEQGPGAWTMYRGQPARTGFGVGAAPRWERLWQLPTLHETATRIWIDSALSKSNATQPILPAFFPIAAGGKIVYRSHRGIHAVERATGALCWTSPSPWGLDALALEANHFAHVSSWVQAYLQDFPHVLCENSVLGTLSSDGTSVFAVDDLAVPPYPSPYAAFISRASQGLQLNFTPALTDAVFHSRLLALDLESGKVIWEVGGRTDEPIQDEARLSLDNSFFLGPPLPLAGKLYVLVEQSQELRLVCLAGKSAEPLWSQKLAVTKGRLLVDGGRRAQAAHPAYAEGLLICPTNAGAILGVDLLSHSLVWAHSYREEPPPPPPQPSPRGRRPVIRNVGPQHPPNLTPDWKVTTPVIEGGKVLFTAPDDPSVHCLNLCDGSPRWKVKRAETDLYLAGVYRDKVLIVGKQDCRALRLSDGKEVWKIETGVPSGQGVACAGVYYLPLKFAAQEKKPAVYALDMEKGVVRGRHVSPRHEEPGNLLFCEGDVLSQTATTLTAYPQVGAVGQE